MKKIGVLITGAVFALQVHSQNIQQQVEKQMKDPQRKANAGKADGMIANKKNIFDSTTFNNITTDTGNGKSVKASTKKKALRQEIEIEQ